VPVSPFCRWRSGRPSCAYRLYELDRIISRTLAYGLLTLLLAGGYAVVVLGLGRLLGRDSSLVVAAATLAVAAVFQPARRRIQQAVDRRFNRRRYDAAQTIQAFSARLREEVDLGTLTAELVAVVEQTMQPTQASLWLRPSHPASSPAGGPTAHPSWSRPDPTAGRSRSARKPAAQRRSTAPSPDPSAPAGAGSSSATTAPARPSTDADPAAPRTPPHHVHISVRR
jgi:hypothetical protein